MPDELVPGFYQGEQRQRGLKSGRVAPRDAVRRTAWSEIQNDNGLQPHHPNQVWTSEGRGYDPEQGALFNVQQIAPRSTQTDESRARELGAVTGRITAQGAPDARTGKEQKAKDMGFAAQPGFMPDLSRKQKIAALENVALARVDQNTHRGGGHFAEIMQDRAAVSARGALQGHHANWYEGTDESGHHDGSVGSAPELIHHVAALSGTNSNAAIRATAVASPQATWQNDNTGEYHNVNAMHNTIKAVKSLKTHTPDPTDEQVRQAGSSVVESGGVLPENTGKAAVSLHSNPDSASAPYRIKSATSQKAPNFEGSLNLSHIDPAVRRIASQSWAVDRHDARVAGMDANANSFQRRGVYEAVAMTGRRQALRTRQLPPNEQSREWVGQRGGGDTPRLMNPDTLTLNSQAVASQPVTHLSRQQRRRDTGDGVPKADLPF